jgi:hypothetical protein
LKIIGNRLVSIVYRKSRGRGENQTNKGASEKVGVDQVALLLWFQPDVGNLNKKGS